MSACVSCEAELVSDTNFCPICGTPVRVSVGSVPGAHAATLPGGPASVGASTEGGVVRRRPGFRLVVIAGTAAVVAVFVALSARSPQSQPDGSEPPATASATTVAVVDDPAAASDDGEAVTTSNSGDDVAAEPVRFVEPLLDGAATGYRVVAADGQKMLDINLDSGEVVRYDTPYEVVGATAGEVLVFDSSIGFKSIPTDDLGAAGRVVFSIPEVSADETRVSTNSLQSAAFRSPSTLIIEFDPSLNSPRDHQPLVFQVDIDSRQFRTFELERSGDLPPVSRSQHGLVWIAGGGLFDVSSGQYQKLSGGYPLLLGVNHAIVERCERPDDCTHQWIFRNLDGLAREDGPSPGDFTDTGSRPLPNLDGVQWIDEVDSEAKVLILNESRNSLLYDVVRGRMLPPTVTMAGVSWRRFRGPVSLSPDGRWLVRAKGTTLALYDLDREVEIVVELGSFVSNSGLVFVPVLDQ